MPVDAIAATSMIDPTYGVARTTGTGTTLSAGSSTSGVDFSSIIGDGLQQVQGLQQTSDDLAVRAATGDLTDVHDYMIAATQAQVATEITVALRNKAVEAFQEIMRMQA